MRSRTSEWFECKVQYEKVMEDGCVKKVTELYTVEALSFTEAEARIIEEMSAYINCEYESVLCCGECERSIIENGLL